MKKAFQIFNILLIIWALAAPSFAQTYVPNSNFYVYNPVFFNPATSVFEKGLSGFLGYRDQWTGFKNAPESGYIGLYGSIKRSGWALLTCYDRAGLFRTFMLQGSSAYKIMLANDNYWALGANLSYRQNFLNSAQVENSDINDPALLSNKFFETILQAGAGIALKYYNFTFALSSPDLYSTVTNKFFQNVYAFVSYQIGKENFYQHHYIKPFALLHYVSPEFLILDIGSEIKFNQTFRSSIILRSNMTATISVNFHVSSIDVGYAYEANIGYSKYVGLSTHEIFLRFSAEDFFAKP